jgi:hypothetical protein
MIMKRRSQGVVELKMIAFSDLIAVLGEPEESKRLQDLHARLGGALRPVKDDTQLSFISYPKIGLSFAYEATLLRKDQPLGGCAFLTAVHLYSQGFESFDEYKGTLPSNLRFEDPREKVREKLGAPSAAGGGQRKLGRFWPPWDRYDHPTHALSVQYADDLRRITMITLIAPIKGIAEH